MRKLILIALCSTIISSPAMAGKTPHNGVTDARIKTISYHSADVFRITAHYGFSTVIEFGINENIETIALGDSQGWQTIKPERGNLLFIKPLETNANTNMTVVTNKRIYTFELSAKAAQSHKSKNLSFRIKFIYPNEMDLALANISKSNNNGFDPKDFTPAKVEADSWNFDYSYSGDKSLRPVRAFDDGAFTYLQFTKQNRTPAVFAVDDQGNESIVNYSMKGKYLVVESLGRQFTLRDGSLATCIFNNSFEDIAQTQAPPLSMSLNDIIQRFPISYASPSSNLND